MISQIHMLNVNTFRYFIKIIPHVSHGHLLLFIILLFRNIHILNVFENYPISFHPKVL